jgi:hypothetical protein
MCWWVAWQVAACVLACLLCWLFVAVCLLQGGFPVASALCMWAWSVVNMHISVAEPHNSKVLEQWTDSYVSRVWQMLV